MRPGLILIVGHNESIVAHALSESSCETGGKLKGSPRNSILRHAARLSIPFLLSVFVYGQWKTARMYLPFPTIFQFRDYNFTTSSFRDKVFISNLARCLDTRISRFQVQIIHRLSSFPKTLSIFRILKNQKSIHAARIFRNKIHGSYFTSNETRNEIQDR